MNLPRSLPRLSRSLLPGSLLVALPSLLWAQAQATTGVVRGTVADSAGGLLYPPWLDRVRQPFGE